jgi:L-lysine 2,3-aminomutase
MARADTVARLPVADDDAAWRAEVRGALTDLSALESAFALTGDERRGIARATEAGFPISITPYYASLIDRDDPACPIRRQAVPVADEATEVPGDLRDPLGEEAHEVAPHLVQRYPDRALLLTTDRCSVYCRFCTRSRMVGQGGGARSLEVLEPAFAHLAAHPAVWVMTHFNHPKELTPIARQGLARLVDHGLPVMNQSVLLRGVNDDAKVLEELFTELVSCRVRPYYLLQADPVRGTGHLRTPLSRGVELLGALQGRVSGLAVPKLIVDTPGGMGKVSVVPDAIVARAEGRTTFRTWRGVDVDYVDPPAPCLPSSG